MLAIDTRRPLASSLERDEFGDRIYQHPSCEALSYAKTVVVYAKLFTTDEDGDNISSLFKVRVLASLRRKHLSQITELAALHFPRYHVVEIWEPSSRSEDDF